MQQKTLDSKQVLDKAITVFSNINSRINSLIECSARDFDILNENFQEYYHRIKVITDFTRAILQTIVEIPETDLEKVRTKLEKITLGAEKGEDTLQQFQSLLKVSEKGLSYTFLDLNHIKQNIGTLKLLATNLQFEPATNMYYSVLIRELIDLSQEANKFECELGFIERRIVQCIEYTQQIIDQQMPVCIQEVKNLYGVTDAMDQKKEDCADCKTRLEKLLSEKSVSSSEIITNLQFQDIIRQKIEHVQQAHEALQQKLCQALAEEEGKDSQIINAAILFQIRDIGSLQAAQLVHANNEYQHAVENITNKFSDLDEILAETIKLQKKMMPEKRAQKQRIVKQFSNSLSRLELEFESMNELTQNLIRVYTDIERKTNELEEMKNSLHQRNSAVSKHIYTLQKSIDTNSGSLEIVNPVKQLTECYADFQSRIDTMLQRLFKENTVLKGGKNSVFENLRKEQHFTEDLFEEILSDSKAIAGVIATKRTKGEEVSKNTSVHESELNLQKVSYYKIFDQEVEQIIGELNSLIETIDFEKLEEKYDRDELEELRNNYTMESERLVHDKLTGRSGKDSSDQEKDDDIELFT